VGLGQLECLGAACVGQAQGSRCRQSAVSSQCTANSLLGISRHQIMGTVYSPAIASRHTSAAAVEVMAVDGIGVLCRARIAGKRRRRTLSGSR
jgi:hypothetical protein